MLLKTEDEREAFGMKLAKAIEPEAWQEFDAGNGVCSNDAGWKCKDSIYAARRVMDMLFADGVISK